MRQVLLQLLCRQAATVELGSAVLRGVVCPEERPSWNFPGQGCARLTASEVVRCRKATLESPAEAAWKHPREGVSCLFTDVEGLYCCAHDLSAMLRTCLQAMFIARRFSFETFLH